MTHSRLFARLLTVLLVMFCCRVVVASASDQRELINHETRLTTVQNATREQYDAALAGYDEYLGTHAYDVVAAVERCRFIDAFAASFEYLDWLDHVYEQQESCGEQLETRYPGHAEVTLYQLENSFGEQRIELGEPLLAEGKLVDWTAGQRARLYASLAAAYEQTDQPRAKALALRALDHDLSADVRLIAARGLIAEQQHDQAREVLLSPFESHDAKDHWYTSQKMQLLVSLGELQPARRLYEQTKAANPSYDHFAAAKLLREMNALDGAREELKQAATGAWNSAEAAAELFQLEYEHGTPQAALEAYEAMRERGMKVDPLATNRVALLARDWSLPWQWRDLLGIGAGFAVIAGVSLLLLAPIGAVHYRGLARRAKNNEPPPSDAGWQLRHAWLAMTLLIVSGIVALYISGPLRLNLDLPAFGIDTWPAGGLGRLALAGEVIALLFAAMMAMKMRSAMPRWYEHWSLAQMFGIALGVVVLLRIPLLMSWAAAPETIDQRLLTQPMLQLVSQVRDHFGTFTAMWWIVIAAPVLEEFVFRGVLREAFAKHISMGWANALQAALFALWHQDPSAMPMLFLFGLIAGTFARRSGGLLAPILMHALFNLTLGLILLF